MGWRNEPSTSVVRSRLQIQFPLLGHQEEIQPIRPTVAVKIGERIVSVRFDIFKQLQQVIRIHLTIAIEIVSLITHNTGRCR